MAAVSSWVLAACAASPPPTSEAALQRQHIRQRIAAFEAQPASQPRGAITKYTLNGEPAYLFLSPCCDRFNYLYAADGSVICAPSGGLHGAGNGKCPAGLKPFMP